MSSIPEEAKEASCPRKKLSNIDLTINCNIDKGQQTRTEDASLDVGVAINVNDTTRNISKLSEHSPLDAINKSNRHGSFDDNRLFN